MRIHYSQLNCPHCGSTNFNLIDADAFLCEYCNQKFNFELENLDFSNENEIFREELKEQFKQKVQEINKKIIYNRILLNKYSALANSRKLTGFSFCSLVISIMLIFSLPLFGITLTLISIIFCIVSTMRAKRKREKYQPLANYYAKNIVEYNKQVDFYNAIISKLTI